MKLYIAALLLIVGATAYASIRTSDDPPELTIDCGSLHGSGTILVKVNGHNYLSRFSCGVSI